MLYEEQDQAVRATMAEPDLEDEILDFGDYSGIDFHEGIVFPAWGDNSNSTLDNPEAFSMELYTSKLRVW